MSDPRTFNIQDADGRFLCPACGFPGYFLGDSYDERCGVIGTGICPCCFWEPGFDDMNARSSHDVLECLREYRARWGAQGPVWLGHADRMPPDWDGKAHFEHLAKVAPFVF